MADKKGAVEVTQPRRYSDINFQGAGDSTPAAAGTRGVAPARVQSQAPASTLSGGMNPPPPAFDRVTSEDRPGDRDRRSKRPPAAGSDPISFALELHEYSDKAVFPWCVDYAGYPVKFSRRYWSEDVIVDLFAGDHPHVREEVRQKREAIIAHNEKASKYVAEMRAKAKDQAEIDQGMLILRRKGDVPFGYAPIINTVRDIDVEGLKRCEIFDLPPAVENDWVPSGVGTRVIR